MTTMPLHTINILLLKKRLFFSILLNHYHRDFSPNDLPSLMKSYFPFILDSYGLASYVHFWHETKA